MIPRERALAKNEPLCIEGHIGWCKTWCIGYCRNCEMCKKIPTNHENKELCSKCGGRCCKSCGCELFPEDFKEGQKLYIKKLKSSSKITG